MKHDEHFVVRYRVPVIVAFLVLTGVGIFFLRFITVNPDITSYLPSDDPVVSSFEYVGKEYGGNMMAMVVLETDNVFTAEIVEYIHSLSSAFSKIKGVSSVTSLTTVLDIRSSAEGIEIAKLIDPYTIPKTDKEFARLREYTLSKELYRKRLVSEDGRATLIICWIRHDADEIAVARALKDEVKARSMPVQVYYGGLPFLMLDVGNIVMHDLKVLIPLVACVVFCAMLLSFRSFFSAALPLLSVAMSTIWTLSLMSICGIPLTVISDLIPVILFAVGSAYGIHVVSRWRHRMSSARGQHVVSRTLDDILVPIVLAGITTMIGLCAFIFGSYLTMIREFGFFAACGVLCATLISVTFLPAVLSFRKPRSSGAVHRSSRTGSRVFRHVVEFGIAHPLWLLSGAGLLFVLLLSQIPKLERKVDIIDYFGSGTHIRRSEAILKQRFGGSMPIQIIVNGDIHEPEVLNAIQRMEIFLESHKDIDNAYSVADIFVEMNDIMGEGRRVPDTRAKVDNLWFLLEGQDMMKQLIKDDHTEAVIQATLASGLETDRVTQLVKAIDTWIQDNSDAACSFTQTGMPLIHHKLDASIKRSQLISVVIAVVLVFLILIGLLRSFVYGVIGLVPIMFSLSMIFGTMGLLKIPLDIATVLVGSISIGIGIDYSIHFLHRYRHEFASVGAVEPALLQTVGSTGKAITINVITVTLGFLVLLFAQLIPLQRFGILVAVTMLGSGFATVIVVPAIISCMRKSKKQKGDNK
jgi:predicted RND superfamily exporter protein